MGVVVMFISTDVQLQHLKQSNTTELLFCSLWAEACRHLFTVFTVQMFWYSSAVTFNIKADTGIHTSLEAPLCELYVLSAASVTRGKFLILDL